MDEEESRNLTVRNESIPKPVTAAAIAADVENVRSLLALSRDVQMPLSNAVMLSPELSRMLRGHAVMMAQNPTTPKHLQMSTDRHGNVVDTTGACLDVLFNALNWRLQANQVARATYALPSGGVGYMGRLVIAIMQASGALKPGTAVQFEHFGDWKKVQGRFKRETIKKEFPGRNGGTYTKEIEQVIPLWSPEDEQGLGVRAWVTLADGTDTRPIEVYLNECHPRNATTWPTQPRLQIQYVAAQRVASFVMPGAIMGVHFGDPEDYADAGSTEAEVGGRVVAAEVQSPTRRALANVGGSVPKRGASQESKPEAPAEPAAHTPATDEEQEPYDPETGEVAGEAGDEEDAVTVLIETREITTTVADALAQLAAAQKAQRYIASKKEIASANQELLIALEDDPEHGEAASAILKVLDE